jgi:hypothetical protein
VTSLSQASPRGSSPETSAGLDPQLKFLAAVGLHFDRTLSIGETPEGTKLVYQLQGAVEGPVLNGHVTSCAASLLINRDGVGLLSAYALLQLVDGALVELEAVGRCDFGEDGYRRAATGDLPNSALGWGPRLLTAHPRYLWLNRVQCLGAGEIRPGDQRVDYDLFTVNACSA